MNQATNRYCENCGKRLNAETRFCGHCGQAVPQGSPAQLQASIPEPQPAAASQPTEVIVTALPPGTQRSGFLGLKSETLVLVLTGTRILVAKQTTQLMQESARQAKEASKESGQNFFGQWGAVMGSSSSQRYLQMQPQEILNEVAGNYSVSNDQIRSVRVKEDFDHDDANSEVKLTLKTVSGKIELTYTRSNQKEIKQALQQTLEDRVR